MRLSDSSASRTPLPAGKAEVILFDDDIPGFGLRIRAAGSRSWVVQYKIGAKNRRMTLGSVKTVNATRARSTAKDILAKVRLGEDPAGDKIEARTAASETFKVAVDRFLELQQRRLRPGSYREALPAIALAAFARPYTGEDRSRHHSDSPSSNSRREWSYRR